MNEGFIAAQIKRTNRNLLITLIILFGLGIGLLAVSARYLTNVLSGPSVIDRAALIKVTNPDAVANYYVTVKADRNVDSGFTQVTTTRSRSGSVTNTRTSGYYRVLLLGDKAILTKMSKVMSGTTVTGALAGIPSDVKRDIIDDIIKDVPDMKDSFLPYMLDATDFNGGAYAIIPLLLILFGLGIFALLQYLRRSSNPENHPIMTALGKFGPAQQVASAIDAVLPANTKGMALPALNLILFPGIYGMKVNGMADLAWAYRVNTRRRGASASAPSIISVNLFNRNGKVDAAPFAYDEARATALLQQINQNAPWVVMGYTAEIEKSWKSNRAAFIKSVDDRRAQMTGGR